MIPHQKYNTEPLDDKELKDNVKTIIPLQCIFITKMEKNINYNYMECEPTVM